MSFDSVCQLRYNYDDVRLQLIDSILPPTIPALAGKKTVLRAAFYRKAAKNIN